MRATRHQAAGGRPLSAAYVLLAAAAAPTSFAFVPQHPPLSSATQAAGSVAAATARPHLRPRARALWALAPEKTRQGRRDEIVDARVLEHHTGLDQRAAQLELTSDLTKAAARDYGHGLQEHHAAFVADELTVVPDDETNPNAALWGSAALLLMACVCGTNFPIIKQLETVHPEAHVAALRFLIAGLPFIGSLACPPAVALAGAEIGAWCSLGYLSQAVGLHLTSASKAAFICALFTVVVPIASAVGLVGGERKAVSLPTWAAVGLALAGTAVLEVGPVLLGGDANAADVVGSINQGDVWCLGTAVGFGLMFARMEHHMEEHADEVLALTAWQCAVLSVAMVGWALFDVHGDVPALLETASSYSFTDMGYLVWTGLFTTAAVLWGETKVMQDVSGTQAGIIFSTEPLFATGFAALLLHETVGVTDAAGAALIMAGCILVVLQGGKEEAAKEPSV